MAQIIVNTYIKIYESTAVVCIYIVIANMFDGRQKAVKIYKYKQVLK